MITFYVKKLPNGFAGMNFWFITLILESHRKDIGLHKHERIHYNQHNRLPLIHPIKYFFSDAYRYKCEVEAYKEQLKYCRDKKGNIKLFSKFIKHKYNLPPEITDNVAKDLA